MIYAQNITEKMAELKCKRTLTLVMGFIECLLFSAIIHGWPSFVFVLNQEGIYEYLCYNSSGVMKSNINWKLNVTDNVLSTDQYYKQHGFSSHYDAGYRNSTEEIHTVALTAISPVHQKRSKTWMCPERNQKFNLAYTLAISVLTLSSAVVGKLFDKFGLWTVRILASLLFIPGCSVLAFIDKERPWMIFPGSIMTATAGGIIIFSNNHLTLLAGGKKSTVSSLYSSGVDCSFGIFLLVKILWENGVSYKLSLGVLTGLWVIVILDTFLLVPKYKVTSVDDKTEKDGGVQHTEKHCDVPSLGKCLSSPIYLLHCTWASLLTVRVIFYLGSFNAWVNDITDGDESKVSHLTNILSYVMFSGILIAPLLGLTMDWCKKRLFATVNNFAGNAFAAMPVLFFSCTMGILLSVCVLIPQDLFIYASFFFLVVFKTSLFGIYYAFFHLVMPKQHYGTLVGLGTAALGITSCLQYPLFIWADSASQNYQKVNIFLLVVCIFAFVYPIYICVINHGKGPLEKREIDNNDLSADTQLLKNPSYKNTSDPDKQTTNNMQSPA